MLAVVVSPVSNDSQSYLVVVDYQADTERKRAEYLFNNWDRGEVEPARGLARFVHDTDIQELYEALVAKVPEEQITAYEIAPVDSEPTPGDAKLELRLDTDAERVEWAVESLLNKRKAVEENADTNEYAVYTKKGRATVSYDIQSGADVVVLRIDIEGYGEAPEFLREYFEDELQYML